MGSRVLGWYLPWQRSVFTLTEPVIFFASMKTFLWNVKFPFSRSLKAQAPTKGRLQTPSLLSCYLLTINYPILTCVHVKVSIIFWSNPRGFPALPSLTSLIYHQWISCNPLTLSPLILMYKIGTKLPFPRAFSQWVEILLPRNCCQFGSNNS